MEKASLEQKTILFIDKSEIQFMTIQSDGCDDSYVITDSGISCIIKNNYLN